MTWQVVKMIHSGTVGVVSEHRREWMADAVAGACDAIAVLSGNTNAYHYDVREKPRGMGLAARCEHGEQMLNECLRCEIQEYEQLQERLSELLNGVAEGMKGKPGPLTLHDWADLPELAARNAETIKKLTALADQWSRGGPTDAVFAGDVRAVLNGSYDPRD